MVIKSDFGPIWAMSFDLTTTQGSPVMSVNNCTGTPVPCIDLRNANLDIGRADPSSVRNTHLDNPLLA